MAQKVGAAARTQVAIIGAGPAGLTLAQMLRAMGVEAVVLETRSREYVEGRIRAGVLEQGTVDLLHELGAADRLASESIRHDEFELRLDGERHVVPVTDLAGMPMTVYGQQDIVTDLIALRLRQGEPLVFDAEVVEIFDAETDRPGVVYVVDGVRHELRADAVVAADGFHGVGRASIPSERLRVHTQDYPFAWLGVMAKTAPSAEHVVYSNHAEGLGMVSKRSDDLSRLYLQVPSNATRAQWPDDKIWEHLHRRLGTHSDWSIETGEITEFSVAPIRSFVAEPMRYGRLFLAGDSAHIVPPTGAKGLNLAVRDARLLAPALAALVNERDARLIDDYSDRCLQHVWWAQYFSCWLTRLVHRHENPTEQALALAEFRTVVSRDSAMRLLAENYVGITG